VSHAVVVVLTETGDDGEVTALMAPYDEDGTWFRGADEDRPESKWDWWMIGGRWDDYIVPGNRCPASVFPESFTPLAILTPDGEWHENGTLGWFGSRSGGELSEEDWEKRVRELLQAHSDKVAVIVDYHV
jgi:hypothetical protein